MEKENLEEKLIKKKRKRQRQWEEDRIEKAKYNRRHKKIQVKGGVK